MTENDENCGNDSPVGLFLQKMGLVLLAEVFPPTDEGYGMDIMRKLSQNEWMKVPTFTKQDLAFYMVQQNTLSYAINFDKIKVCCEFVLKDIFGIKDQSASSLLIYEFQSIVKNMLDKINFPEQTNLKEIPYENGMFFLDSRFFSFMSNEFSKESKSAEYLKNYLKIKINESKERLKNYTSKNEKNILDLIETIWAPNQKLDEIPVFALELSRRLWEFRVEKRWKRKTLNKPAIVMPIGQCVINACWNPNNKIKEIDSRKYITTTSGAIIATITEKTLITIEEIQKRHSFLNSLLGHKIFRYLVKEYQTQFFDADDREPGTIEIEGGREKFAEILGLKSKEDATNIPEILKAGQEFSMELPGLTVGGLWTYVETKGIGRNNKSHISITLGPALKPHYMYKFKKENQILIPIVSIPTLVNPKNYHGQQAAAQFTVVQHILNDRKFLRTYGGGFFSKEVLSKISSQTCLPESVLFRAWDAWQKDSNICEAFLERVDKDIFQIANNNTFKDARECIDYLAKQSKNGSDRAKQRINKRQEIIAH